MTSARAIQVRPRTKPATLRASASIPIAFTNAAATHIVRPHFPPTSKARQRVPLPLLAETFGRQASPVINDED